MEPSWSNLVFIEPNTCSGAFKLFIEQGTKLVHYFSNGAFIKVSLLINLKAEDFINQF